MAYSKGTSAIKKHNYRVFVRRAFSSSNVVDVEGQYQIAGMLSQLSTHATTLTGITAESDIDTVNVNYNVSGSLGNVIVTLASLPVIAGITSGDVLSFTVSNSANLIDIIDETPTTYEPDAVGERILFYYDGSDWLFLAWVNTDGTAYNQFFEIGAMAAEPKITVEEGDSVPNSEGDKIVLNNVINVEMFDLQVTKDNYEYCRDNLADYSLDIMFYDANYPEATIGLYGVTIDFFPEIKGNTNNMVKLVGSRDASNILSVLTLHDA